MTRNQAIKKLQLRLSEFRRLCILKGIHPRDPKKKTQGQHKTYYHVKDIAFLLHEPMLKKIREIAAHEKKIKRAMAKKNPSLAKKIAGRRPDYRLDHLVKERYPSLMDALRDLDDALAMIHLFAVLPADQVKGVEVSKVQLSRRLALEWQAYVVCANALRKSFVSVKGFYYQAEVKGQPLTWMVPHQVSQVLPPDVDFKVMTTFLEFYQSTLQFVMFSLYAEMGIQYPPNVDDAVDEAGILSIGNTAHMIEEVRKGEASEAAVKKIRGKIQDLEKEIQEMAGRERGGRGGEPEESEESGDEAELPELDEGSSSDDSGDDGNDEENSEESEDDDPEDEDIPVHRAVSPEHPEASDEAAKPSTADAALVGGAVDVADEESICSSLFSGMKFFLGREVPREQLSLVIQSFGGVVGWDGAGSPYDEADARITHQIIDRPKPLVKYENRLFVQPQWVFDSTNNRVLVNAAKYAPGITPPPHLSPFVQPEDDDHVPEYAKEIQELKDAAQRARLKAAGEAVDDEFLGRDQQDDPAAREEASLADLEQQHADELAKELGGDDAGKGKKKAASRRSKQGDEEPADDEAAMASHLMTRKVKRAYQKAMQEKAAKRARTAKLGNRAAALKKL